MTNATPPARSPLRAFLREAWSILRLAAPVIATRAGMIIMITIDTAMVGRAGTVDLAHFAVAFPPQTLGFIVIVVLLSAGAILAGQAMGAGRLEECGRIWRVALLVGIALGLLIGGVLALGDRLLLLLGQAPDLADGGGRVLSTWALGMPGIAIYVATAMFLEAMRRPLPGLVIVIIGNVVNAGLNWILIYGNLGAPPMGPTGAVLATSLVRWLMAGLAVAYVLSMPDARRWGVYGPLGPAGADAARLLRLGLPLAFGSLLEIMAFFAFATFAGWLGSLPLAAYQIALNIMSTVYMAAIGISVATSVHVSMAVGRGRSDEVARAGWAGAAVVGTVMAVATSGFLAFAPSIVGFYTSDPILTAIVGAVTVLIAAIFLFDGMQMVLLGATRAVADVTVPAAIFFVAFVMIAIPLAYTLGPRGGAAALIGGDAATAGVTGILTAAFVSLTLSSLLLGLRFAWISRRRLPQA
jgi:MATE family multidrug resistance protein